MRILIFLLVFKIIGWIIPCFFIESDKDINSFLLKIFSINSIWVLKKTTLFNLFWLVVV